MASLSNQYQCIDDYGNATSLTTNGPTGGTSGQPIGPVFVATSIANAITTAYLVSSAFQRPVRLVAFGGNPPWTLVTGAVPAIALTAVPSGTSY